MGGRHRLAMLGICLGVAAPSLGEEKAGLPLRVSIRADMNVTLRTSKQTVAAKSDFDYRLTRTPEGVETSIDHFTLTTKANGRETSHTEMGRDTLLIREGGETKSMTRATAPREALAILDGFGAPLAVIKLDPEGGEVGRRFMAGKGPMADPAMVDNTRIFHPNFPRDRAAWDAPAVFPLGKGQKAKGTLHYVKRKPPGDGGPVFVDVSGVLAVQGMLGKATIKSGTYKVSGTQTYDPALGEWVAGDLDVTMSFDATAPDGAPVKGGGTVALTMFRRDPE